MGAKTMAMSLVKITRAAAPVVPRLQGLVIRGNSSSSKDLDSDLFPGAYSHKDHMGVEYTKQKRNKSRPTSPHVTIYAWPPAAISRWVSNTPSKSATSHAQPHRMLRSTHGLQQPSLPLPTASVAFLAASVCLV